MGASSLARVAPDTETCFLFRSGAVQSCCGVLHCGFSGNLMTGARLSSSVLRLSALVLGVWGLFCYVFFEGLQGSDDLSYLRFAWFWDRVPINHWELRITYNVLLRGAIKTFGLSEATAALPTLLGGAMTILATLAVLRQRHGNGFTTLVGGLVVATLPGIVYSTTPNARPLAVGLLSVGFAIALTRTSHRALIASGLLLGAALATHLSLLFVGAFSGLSLILAKRITIKQGVLLASASLGGFFLVDTLPYLLWTGDPLYRFHTISASHLKGLATDPNARHVFDASGAFVPRFLTHPFEDLLLSRRFVATFAIGVIAAAIRSFRALDRVQRSLSLALLMGWGWMSFGTHALDHYEPFPGTTPYWGGLILPVAVFVAEAIAALPRRLAFVALAAIILSHVASLGLGGPWGQSVEVSAELLDQVRRHPDQIYVSDDRTLLEIVTLNGYATPKNLYRISSDSTSSEPLVPLLEESRRGEAHLLINDLNLRRTSTEAERWIRTRSGEALFTTSARYRTLTYLLPESYRERHQWTMRHPGARVLAQRP